MRHVLLLLVLLMTARVYAQPAGENSWADDEAVLAKQKLPTKGPELLTIVRARTPSPAELQRLKEQIATLKSAAYAERMKATAELKKMGPVIRPLLVELLRSLKTDAETAGRVRLVLEHFSAEQEQAILMSAARLIGRDKPAGSLKPLLELTPYVVEESVRQEVQRAIDAAASQDESLLKTALKDTHPARRAAAAEALVRTAKGNVKDAVGPLLRDPHPLVRYQLGVALVERHDKAGLPLVIGALTDPEPERVERALDLLQHAAGLDAPSEVYSGPTGAAAFQAAWTKWHKQHHARLDLARALAKSDQGFTVISCFAAPPKGGGGKSTVYELGDDHTTIRWAFDGPRYPIDVQILGPNRLLMAEYLNRRVTERDFKGNILWQVAVNLPIACQRLSSGHTFIATRQQLLIVDRQGQSVFTWQPPIPQITAAQRLRNGQIAVVTGGRCLLLNTKGETLKSFALQPIYTIGGNIEVLSNGHVLAPLYSSGCVVEYDWNGNKLWQANITQPTAVSRLANGNLLVTCKMQRRVVEITRAGAEVWSIRTDGQPFRARPR